MLSSAKIIPSHPMWVESSLPKTEENLLAEYAKYLKEISQLGLLLETKDQNPLDLYLLEEKKPFIDLPHSVKKNLLIPNQHCSYFPVLVKESHTFRLWYFIKGTWENISLPFTDTEKEVFKLLAFKDCLLSDHDHFSTSAPKIWPILYKYCPLLHPSLAFFVKQLNGMYYLKMHTGDLPPQEIIQQAFPSLINLDTLEKINQVLLGLKDLGDSIHQIGKKQSLRYQLNLAIWNNSIMLLEHILLPLSQDLHYHALSDDPCNTRHHLLTVDLLNILNSLIQKTNTSKYLLNLNSDQQKVIASYIQQIEDIVSSFEGLPKRIVTQHLSRQLTGLILIFCGTMAIAAGIVAALLLAPLSVGLLFCIPLIGIGSGLLIAGSIQLTEKPTQPLPPASNDLSENKTALIQHTKIFNQGWRMLFNKSPSQLEENCVNTDNCSTLSAPIFEK